MRKRDAKGDDDDDDDPRDLLVDKGAWGVPSLLDPRTKRRLQDW